MSFGAAQVLDASRSQTGWEDFGSQTFREGLDVLVGALQHEARLSPAGEQTAWAHLTQLLATRLEIEACYRRYPEIEAQPVIAPIFILGLPRTGTTALSYLMAQDPETRCLRFWESQAPTPPPETATQDSDPRIAVAQQILDAMHGLFPELVSMYFATATSATECQDVLGREFRTHHFAGMYQVPTYAEWQMSCDMEPAYRYHRRTLQLLQWRCPPTRWLLKTPVHMLSLEALNRVYPDARFIMTHRDPAAVLGSVCSLITVMYRMTSDTVDAERLGRMQVRVWAEALQRLIDFRRRHGDTRFVDLSFDELEETPVEAVAHAYARLQLPFTDTTRARMQQWCAENPRGKHGEHRYRLEDYGLNRHAVAERFAFYRQRFAVATDA